jgi:hypothetical protein
MEFLKDFSVYTGLALLFLLLSWSYGRALSGGRPLNTVKRRILLYAFVFVLGTMYIMLLVSDLRWSNDLLFPLTGVWGGIVGLMAWWRHQRVR